MTVSESMNSPLDRDPASKRPEAGLRVPRSEETRRRLLEAGRALFANLGPHAVTSHAIAAQAGYASGTFYLHFKDKLALFRELAEEAARELEDRVRKAGSDQSEPMEMMQAQAEALVGFAEEQRDLIRIVFHPGGEAADIGSRILERLASGVSARRREAVADGRARDCFDSDVLAQAIVGMWAHVLAWWAEDPSRATRESIIRTLTHFQLHGNRAEAGTECSVPLRANADSTTTPSTPTTPNTPPAGEPSR
jgi:AcrR family transcriptional regulator